MKEITHEEARNELVEIENYLEHSFDLLNDYITQQEKKDELLELYREKDTLSKNPYKNIDTKEIKPYYEWACELKTLEKQIKALEEDLK